VVIYDLRNGRRIMPKRLSSGRLQVLLPLLPGSAAVLAVYQREPKDLNLSAPDRFERGSIGFVDVNLRGADGSNLNGRHGIDLMVTKPDGSQFDASAIYCTESGHTRIPLRLPLDAPVGDWKITGRHLASGLTDETVIAVE